jgi:hypothetical protein
VPVPNPTGQQPAAPPALRTDAGLLVHTTPAGAMVAVDGRPRGRTPVAIRGLELGTRRVRVDLPGHGGAERHVALTRERPSRALEIDLRPVMRSATSPAVAVVGSGVLVIDSRPTTASVFIDGRAAGVTPLVLAVPVGPHTVRLERDGYRAVTSRVDVKDGMRTRVAARLEGGQDEE